MTTLLDTALAAVAAKLTFQNVVALGLLLGLAVLCAVIVFVRSHPDLTWREAKAFFVPTEILTHRSARADLAFWITRRLLMPLLMLPAGAAIVIGFGHLTHAGWLALLGLPEPAPEPAGPVLLVLFTVSMLLAYDLSYYFYHKLQHRVPFLWELHKVHHSAEVLVGITKDRVHPLDDVMNRLWDAIIPGTVYGLWLFVAKDPVELTVFGINVYVMRNILMMDFIRHTHLKISFGFFDRFVISPHAHQLHHSTDPAHYDRNFGLVFATWDRLFGTFAPPKPDESFDFGLGERESAAYQSLFGLYVLPLKRMADRLLELVPVRRFLPARRQDANT